MNMPEHLLDTLNGNMPQESGPSWPSNEVLESNMMVNGHHGSGPGHDFGAMAPVIMTSESTPTSGSSAAAAAAAAAAKKSSSRRNAWGNLSYADLITQAIQSTPEKRLTLSQVYEWMVANIPYFKDKGDSNSSAGWKNSIRHNLSLHSRFVRVQNEGTGKSSWWMLNPDAKPGGKTSRRRAASVEGGNGNPNSSGGRGPDFKRRGRNKKNSAAVAAQAAAAAAALNGGAPPAGNGLMRNGHGHPDSTPSPNAVPHGNFELYPESPSLHHQYPFPPGRMSPSSMLHPEHPAFGQAGGGYPGQQEWAGDYQCGSMPYFAGNPAAAGRGGYCESIGSSQGANEVDYQQGQQRPLSPQLLQRNPGGFPSFPSNRFPSPSTPSNNGNENFHSFHAEKLPNHSIADTANTFPSIQQVMSPSNGPPQNVSPSGGNSISNHNREAAAAGGNRSFSSPDAHRPGSTDPLISPHHLGGPPQSFFPQQPPGLASMRPPTPGSPGSVKSAKNNNGSILERALASTIKSEHTPMSSGAASITTNTVGSQQPMQEQPPWPPQAPGPQGQQGYDLGSEVFMKHEIGIDMDYDLNYSNAMAAAAAAAAAQGQAQAPGMPGHQGHHQGHGGVHHRGGHQLHHHHHHVQEDHLHSPSQYSMATQQPPWVR